MHFWRADNAVEYSWMPPADTADGVALRRRALPEDAAPALRAAGVAGVVAVQARQTLGETYWLLGLADAAPAVVRGVVGFVDLRAPDAAAALATAALHPALVGVRHVIHDEPDPVAFMASEAFNAGLAALPEHNLVYDLLLFPAHLSAAAALARRHPRVRFVLDHAGKPPLAAMDSEEGATWRAGIAELAACANVACKVSGLLTCIKAGSAWEPPALTPALDAVWASFGPDRLLFGSDFPVSRLAGEDAGSGRFVAALEAYVGARGDAGATAKLFAGNARVWYPRLGGRVPPGKAPVT